MEFWSRSPRPTRTRWRRLAVTTGTAAALVAVGVVQVDTGDRDGDYRTTAAARADADRTSTERRPHTHPASSEQGDGHGHDHNDPTTKNSISRAGTIAPSAQDPTTDAEAARSVAYATASRTSADPTLTTVRLTPPRTTVPTTRYAMARGCYSLAGRPIRFQATDLGSYLLYTAQRTFVSPNGTDAAPSPQSDWIVTMHDGRFRFRLTQAAGGTWLRHDATGFHGGTTPQDFALRLTDGCASYPEIGTQISGGPRGGVTPWQEVRGWVDPHVHGMAFEFLGGDAHCGRPWHRYGVAYALVDCPDHSATQGHGAVLESLLSGEPSHDPVGWPTFKDWPAPESLTHEGVYYTWLERAWRGGLRVYTNLLVENNKLCELYPIKHNSCDDMDSLRLQARDMRKLERYIDAQYGGPGRGWYRIVTDPFQARRVINSGRLAVIMGIETSIPFGCTMKLDVPACDEAKIDAGLAEMRALGVRQMELVNKFDNALAGVAGDEGEVGVAVNSANFLETGSFWDMRHCEPADGETHDRTQLAAPEIDPEQQDALFGAIGALYGATHVALPVYGPPAHCNERGLTPLGEHLVNELADQKMLFDPDHMSVRARQASLDVMEARDYPGVISSHSWSTPDTYPRIYALGGFVAPYAGDSTGFVEKWRRHLTWADPRYYFGFGFGADMNGLGAQGNPRGADVANPVRYPFTGLGGVTVNQQVSGQRRYDLNVDGVAHYGLYPDWVRDLALVAGGSDGTAITEDLSRGAEAYLQTWERATGIAADPCRNPNLRRTVAGFGDAVRVGMTYRQVLSAVGQPFTRLGSRFGYCARTSTEPRVPMTVSLGADGRVVSVGRTQ